jgi:hypothetical protein
LRDRHKFALILLYTQKSTQVFVVKGAQMMPHPLVEQLRFARSEWTRIPLTPALFWFKPR